MKGEKAMKRMSLILILIIFWSSNQSISFGQNLLSGGNFDLVVKCPDSKNGLKYVAGWSTDWTDQNPDVFHECGLNGYGYDNKYGFQEAYDGKGYAGIQIDLREKATEATYFQISLNKQLYKDSMYQLSMAVSLPEKMNLMLPFLGAYFSDKKTILFDDYGLFPSSFLLVKSDSVLNGTEQWVKIDVAFKAKGNEEFLLIGNFAMHRNAPQREIKKPYFSKKNTDFTYYYIDAIELQPMFDEEPVLALREEIIEIPEEKLVLENINFASGKSELLSSSFSSLDGLYDFLTRNSKRKILVQGHTDNTGKISVNDQLSSDRAEAICIYLINKGIDTKRLTYEGKGSSMPIASNDTPEGRKQNRRVEVHPGE